MSKIKKSKREKQYTRKAESTKEKHERNSTKSDYVMKSESERHERNESEEQQ